MFVVRFCYFFILRKNTYYSERTHMKRVHIWLFNVKYMQGYVKSTQSSQTVGYVCESEQLGKKLHVYQYITYEDSFSWVMATIT